MVRGRKNWFRGILRAILGRAQPAAIRRRALKMRPDECIRSSSRRVPCVIPRGDGIRKRRKLIESDRERGYDSTVEGKEIEKGEGERAETLTLLGETWRETLPRRSRTRRVTNKPNSNNDTAARSPRVAYANPEKGEIKVGRKFPSGLHSA